MKPLVLRHLLFASLFMAGTASAYNDTISTQNTLIGATPAIQASLNYGSGVLVGDLDTGTTPRWLGFQPQYNGFGQSINTALSGTCLNGICTTGGTISDGNGHGTFTSSLITGGVPSAGLVGVAPASTLFSVQVLSASGSGYGSDLANGIVYATNKGAKVLNLSIGPNGTASQQALFYDSLAPAINYAASHNVTIVFAGGNASQMLAGGFNITGFSDKAISQMIFAGSTNANKLISTFSNTPGAGGFVSTTGKFYSYQNLWVMAQGENITAASNYSTPQYGYGYLATGSGTSFAAPQATGAIALLESRWPILATNGTAAQLLEVTTTDLGAKGVDATYGEGFINLTTASNPVGGLFVKAANGSNIALTSLTGSMITGGALGSLASVSKELANYTAFDSYTRNFTVNLSGLITTKPTTSSLAQSVTAPQVTSAKTKFTDGGSFAFSSAEPDAYITPYSSTATQSRNWAMSFSDGHGSVASSGYGFPVSASFGEALWGESDDPHTMPESFGALAGLAEGGNYVAYGTQLAGKNRIAVAWNQTAKEDLYTGSGIAQSSAISIGLSHELTQNWKAGITVSSLKEDNGLLGTASGSNSAINFGSQNDSRSISFSSVYSFSSDTEISFDASIAKTAAASYTGSIIAGTSDVYSRSFGVALTDHNRFQEHDKATLSLVAPLRVTSGSASLISGSVDANGNPVLDTQKVGLAPNGREMDLTANYQIPVQDNLYWDFTVQGRRDVENIEGLNDVTALVKMKFDY